MKQNGIKPFFTFYGGKWRAAPRYPRPMYGAIIEPFAGSAGYSLRYPESAVTLVEKDPIIASLWEYLIGTSPRAIMSLPDEIDNDRGVDALSISAEEKTLIGFWLNKGSAVPCRKPSAWMRSGIRPNSYWGPMIKRRIADQLERISHWRIVCGDFTDSPDVRATWFVDPPYRVAGQHYRFSSGLIDYTSLGDWCRNLRGLKIVCENSGADWLPFSDFDDQKGTPGKNRAGISKEAIWCSVNAGEAEIERLSHD